MWFTGLVTLLACVAMVVLVFQVTVVVGTDLASENVLTSLRAVARALSTRAVVSPEMRDLLDGLWRIPGERRWLIGEDGSVVLGEDSDELLGLGETLLLETDADVRMSGRLGRRRAVGAVRIDERRILVVELTTRGSRTKTAGLLLLLPLAMGGAALTAGLLLSRLLARPFLGRLDDLRRVLERYGKGETRLRLDDSASEAELADVYDAFNRMAERIGALELERARRLEDERALFAGLAHDVNTPMTVIRGYAELLHDRLADHDDGQLRRMASELLGQSLYVQAIVDDLLAMAKAEGRTLTASPERLALDPLFDALVDAFEPVASKQGIQLLAEAHGLEAWADPLRLRQVLTNLVRNALVHARGATVIELDARPEGHGVVLAVEDDGPGVAEELVPHVFERYRRGREEGRQGWGLGLTIVRLLCELHGGECRYVSGRPGARFEVFLPGEPP